MGNNEMCSFHLYIRDLRSVDDRLSYFSDLLQYSGIIYNWYVINSLSYLISFIYMRTVVDEKYVCFQTETKLSGNFLKIIF